MLLIDQKIFRRSTKLLRNSPFVMFLFQNLQKGRLSTKNVYEKKSKYLNKEFMFINSSSFIENLFLKLFKIITLRGEEEGQGLTSKVLFTSIGRQVLKSGSGLFSKKFR